MDSSSHHDLLFISTKANLVPKANSQDLLSAYSNMSNSQSQNSPFGMQYLISQAQAQAVDAKNNQPATVKPEYAEIFEAKKRTFLQQKHRFFQLKELIESRAPPPMDEADYRRTSRQGHREEFEDDFRNLMPEYRQKARQEAAAKAGVSFAIGSSVWLMVGRDRTCKRRNSMWRMRMHNSWRSRGR